VERDGHGEKSPAALEWYRFVKLSRPQELAILKLVLFPPAKRFCENADELKMASPVPQVLGLYRLTKLIAPLFISSPLKVQTLAPAP